MSEQSHGGLFSLIKNPHLFPYITGLKTLDQIYLDTTFSYRGEPYIYIMPNSEGIFAAIELLKLYPFDSDLSFFVDTVSIRRSLVPDSSPL